MPGHDGQVHFGAAGKAQLQKLGTQRPSASSSLATRITMATILVIDDDAQLCATMKEIVSAAGHTVVTAANGREGGQALRERQIDLVVTDIYMPEADGLELITHLQKSFPNTKIIAISGRHGPMNMLPVAKKLGVTKTLAKPFTPQEFLGAVAQVLDMN